MAGLRLLVPFNRTPASHRGLDVALSLADSEKDSRVYAVFVVEVDRRFPLDADLPDSSDEGERCLAEAEDLAQSHRTICEGEILQARDAGTAIVDEAVELGVDAIVLGVERGSEEGQVFEAGHTADFILRHAPCEVIVVRDGIGT